MRYRQAVIVVKVLFAILVSGLFYIQIIRGDYYYQLSKKNTIRIVSLEAARGKIFDRNNIVLADTIPSFDISVIPQEIKDKTILFNRLSELLGVSFEEVDRKYRKNFLNPFIPVQIYEKLDKEKIIALEENKLNLSGVIVEVRPKRSYPFNRLVSHVLGYLGKIDSSRITRLKPYGYKLSDSVGYSGVEEYYDLVLRGQKGGEQVEVDNRGRKVRMVGYKPPISGKDIQITLDIRIQKVVDKFMSGRSGAVVIMDPYSGEIIALSSYPNYNPDDFALGTDMRVKKLLNDKRAPLLNRAISGRYAPGSIFKVVTAMAALEKDSSLKEKNFNCEANLKIGNRDFSCWSQHDNESLRDAVVHSCNIYFYNLGLHIRPEFIKKYALRFGLGKKTGIDLKYETKGFIPSPQWRKISRFQAWYSGDTANMSIGQGEILVTPIQMTRMVSVIINGGKLVRPHLIKAIGDKNVSADKEKVINLSKDSLDIMRSYLYDVINDSQGTAQIAKVDGLEISGKTGTAQVSGKRAHGWLVGYAGRDKPRYAFCIFLEHGGSSYAASLVARNILKEMLEKDLI